MIYIYMYIKRHEILYFCHVWPHSGCIVAYWNFFVGPICEALRTVYAHELWLESFIGVHIGPTRVPSWVHHDSTWMLHGCKCRACTIMSTPHPLVMSASWVPLGTCWMLIYVYIFIYQHGVMGSAGLQEFSHMCINIFMGVHGCWYDFHQGPMWFH